MLFIAAIEGHQQSLRDVVLPKNLQEVEFLLGLCYQLSSESCPGQVLVDVDSQEVGARDPLHTIPIEDKWLDMILSLPQFQYQLLCLCSVEEQVVTLTPLCQPFHLVPVGGQCGVIGKFDYGVTVVCRSAVVSVEGIEQGVKHAALWSSARGMNDRMQLA